MLSKFGCLARSLWKSNVNRAKSHETASAEAKSPETRGLVLQLPEKSLKTQTSQLTLSRCQ